MPCRILFVCGGNTCRSPMAQAIARGIAEGRGESGKFHFDSAGLSPNPEDPITMENAVKAVDQQGFGTAMIKGRKWVDVPTALKTKWNLVIVMDPSKKENEQLRGQRVISLKELAGKTGRIDDPYKQPLPVYVATAAEIRALLVMGWDRLQSECRENP